MEFQIFIFFSLSLLFKHITNNGTCDILSATISHICAAFINPEEERLSPLKNRAIGSWN